MIRERSDLCHCLSSKRDFKTFQKRVTLMDPRPATHHYLRMSMLCHSGEALARQLDKTVTVAVDR